MTDGWDERTEAIPGTRDDKSFELDLDLAGEVPTPLGTEALARPLIVVFEPAPLGIAMTLHALGYQVIAGNTGVDVMSIVAARSPRLVVCAPAPDAERRRLLAAALRLRFPHVPIVYVSSHAAHEEAVLGALREGARTVLPWPLPAKAEIERVLSPYLAMSPASLEVNHSGGGDDTEAPTAPAARPLALHDVSTGPVKGPASDEGDFLGQRTLVTGEGDAEDAPAELADPAAPPVATRPVSVPQLRAPTTVKPPAPPTDPRASMLESVSLPRPVPLPVSVLAGRPEDDRELELEPTTQPNLRPAANVGVEAAQERRGEIGELLAAISPFLWSLEDAARWASQLGDQGDPVARNHARALQLLAKILAQLQARIDETGA